MRKSLIIACLVAMAGLSATAQNSAINTAIFAKQNFDYVKAKATIDKAVLHEKTSTSAKAWYYRGEIYQNIAAMKSDWDSYLEGLRLTNVTEYSKALDKAKNPEALDEIKNLSDDPSAIAFESYMKSRSFDTKGKHKNDIDNNLRSLTIVDFNEAGKLYNEGTKGKEVDKDMLMASYNFYDRVLTMVDAMGPVAQVSFKFDLTSGDDDDGDAMDEELKFIHFYMARVAYYSDQNDLAKAKYQELIDMKYESADIYRELANIYASEDNVQAQKDLWATARENLVGNNEIAIDEAAFYQRIGETDVLFDKLEEAIRLNPDEPSLYNVLGGIYTQKIVSHNNEVHSEEPDEASQLSDEDYKKYFARAEELLGTAQEMAPSEPSNWTQLGSLYLSEGLVAYNSNNGLSFSAADQKKSKVYVEQFKASFAKAKVQFEKALEVDPENQDAAKYLKQIELWSN